jgi:hypothetical protein
MNPTTADNLDSQAEEGEEVSQAEATTAALLAYSGEVDEPDAEGEGATAAAANEAGAIYNAEAPDTVLPSEEEKGSNVLWLTLVVLLVVAAGIVLGRRLLTQ